MRRPSSPPPRALALFLISASVLGCNLDEREVSWAGAGGATSTSDTASSPASDATNTTRNESTSSNENTSTTGESTTGGESTGGSSTSSESSNGSGGQSGNTTTSSTTGGTGGEAGAPPTCPVTEMASEPVPIVHDNGWVDCSSNGIGIQGAFYPFSDEGDSVIEPGTFEGTSGDLCVSGTVGMVIDGDFSQTWGASIGFNLRQAEGESPQEAWDAGEAGIRGITFTIDALPEADLRVGFWTELGDHCLIVPTEGVNQIDFADTRFECWASGGAPPDESDLRQIQWQVVADEGGAHDFDFCITDLAFVP